MISMAAMLLVFTVKAQDTRALMNIGGDDISVQEFLNIYNKNNTNNVVDKKTMEEYVDLFVNFKLKVKEAESLGMDTAEKFVRELSGYRNQLAQPYLIDRSINEQLIEEAYKRMKEDVAAYHILLRIEPNASPADTMKTLNDLKKIAKGIKNETDMKRVIAELKADGKENTIAEDLGYFTAFSMVYPFENAAYNTPVGTLSQPIRTRFGYHVVFVRDKRPARGEVKVAHIFIKSTADQTEDEHNTAKSRIDEISQRIKSGESFEEMVKAYSEDKATSSKGGVLPWFGTGGTASVFEDAAFALKNNGDMSEPILSNYGWHIIKREDYRGIAEFEELKPSIKKRIEKDSRGLKGRSSLINKLKEEYAITYNIKNRDIADKLVSTDYLEGKWRMPKENEMKAPIMTITDNVYSKKTKSFTQNDYLKYLEKHQRKSLEGESIAMVIRSHWDGFVDAMLIDFEDANLEAKHPEFKALMQEYHDGILLFDLMDERVWSKAVKDSSGLNTYYNAHKTDFMWDQRTDASIYQCANESVANQTLKLAKKRTKKSYTDSYILSQVNASNPLNLTIKSGLYTKDEDAQVDASPAEIGIHKISKDNEKPVYVQVYSIRPPQPKNLSEARGMITSGYQGYLEEQWIKELRAKYPVQINEAVFNSINK